MSMLQPKEVERMQVEVEAMDLSTTSSVLWLEVEQQEGEVAPRGRISLFFRALAKLSKSVFEIRIGRMLHGKKMKKLDFQRIGLLTHVYRKPTLASSSVLNKPFNNPLYKINLIPFSLPLIKPHPTGSSIE
ncbi:hypothetical protein HPP92_017444 [Vanilla planifolia]|uniref:Uncharacterized protein n=1 Tax=Vanilla planifolia TaxID=51239 RepID=A0A835QJH9_VANPL|nr:hypothetical protein HPP92_017444 [Vanilla planifolia]